MNYDGLTLQATGGCLIAIAYLSQHRIIRFDNLRHARARSFLKTPWVVDWVKVNKYGRKVGKILLSGLDCNLEQIKRGLAWHYKQYQREQSPADQQSYAAAEIEARAAKLGLWRDVDLTPPWEFRHKGAR